ncbi:MAG: hypothetical protein QXV41_06535 [Zestosphaera sp.]
MRVSRIAKIAEYTLIAHQILLVLLALADLGLYIFFYLTLIKSALLLKFRVRLFLSGLPKDLRKSAYSLYKSYVRASLSTSSIRNLLSLVSRDYR